jgi:hypothetical protein
MSSFRRHTIVTAAAAAALLSVSLAQASSARFATSSRTAERHVLNSPRFFLHWGGKAARVVDPQTRWLRTSVTAVCRARASRAHTFVCTVRYRSIRLRVLHVSTGRRSFRLVRRASH